MFHFDYHVADAQTPAISLKLLLVTWIDVTVGLARGPCRARVRDEARRWPSVAEEKAGLHPRVPRCDGINHHDKATEAFRLPSIPLLSSVFTLPRLQIRLVSRMRTELHEAMMPGKLGMRRERGCPHANKKACLPSPLTEKSVADTKIL